jgi:fibronectin-binding autotransporter adhesin
LKLHILIAILLITGPVAADTLRVCSKGCDYSSIQQAIEYANPGDTINVSEGIYKENIKTTKPLSIEGAGIGRTIIDGSYFGPVFTIGPAPSSIGALIVTLSGMTIEHGQADFGGGIYNLGSGWNEGDSVITLIDCNITHNVANNGGGIWNGRGLIKLNDSTITNNRATYPGSGAGGGIYDDSLGMLDIDAKSSIINNTAIYSGGGISSQGKVNLNGGIITGNRAAIGGGIYTIAVMNMTSGFISNNTANVGGGIYFGAFITPNLLNLTGGSIDHNYAETYGGGIYNNQCLVNLSGTSIDHNYARMFGGGAIYNNLGWVNLNGSSISNNYAGTYGGGIYDNVDTIHDSYSTVNLIMGSIDHNIAKAKLSGGGIYNVYGTVIIGNRSLVHENTPDQIRTVGS